MNVNEESSWRFMSDMSERQITAQEIFNCILLESLEKQFSIKNTLIICYDENANFLSWTDRQKILFDSPTHPYHDFSRIDVVANYVNRECKQDHLTYDNVEPRIYRATDIYHGKHYDTSLYAKFLSENFDAKYSVVLPFGPDGFIHLLCLKKENEGDFSEEEMEDLKKIYTFVACTYRNFKHYEQHKIMMDIQNEIITSGEKAYLITDSNMHIMEYNDQALQHLENILGKEAVEEDMLKHCTWLPFLLAGADDASKICTKEINGMVFKVYTFEQKYIHGIVERYHWITISPKETLIDSIEEQTDVVLTPTEMKVADLLCDGLTYRAIADELYISYHTVKKHVQNIFYKYHISSRYQLYHCYKKRRQGEKR